MEHPTWTEQLPEAMRTEENYAVLDKYEKLGDFTADFFKVNGDISKLAGERDDFKGKVESLTDKLGNMIAIPSENATDEEWGNYYRKIGVPDSIEGYELEQLAKDDLGKELLGEFKKANMPKAQAKAMVEFLQSYYATQTKAQAEAKSAAVEEYKKKLGKDADIHFKNANDAINHFFGTDDDSKADREAILSSPKQIGVFSRIGTLLKERPFIFKKASAAGGGSKDMYPSMAGLDD